jgi:pimeloyl-ACP methyl ester carboxylesterase/class 3 adenylate cyclase
MESPVRYAKNGGVHIAYRVFGDGPRDIVLVPGSISHVEIYWELPVNAYMLKRLCAFARVIVFDKRGQGLSDRVAEMTLEERTDDVRAVMDAAGSKEATIYGWSEGGQMCVAFSASYPERTSALVLVGSFASLKGEPFFVAAEQQERILQDIEAHWGEGASVALNAPSLVNDTAFVQWFGRLERASASPGALVALYRAGYQIDVSHLLPAVRVPSLIIHRVGDSTVGVEGGRHLARHIPGAKYLELPGIDHMLQALDQDLLDFMLDEIEQFITGAHHRPEPDRVLTTLMFTDIVSSSEHAARLGDRRWLELLASFFTVARSELEAFRGREVDTGAGDGFLASFDGPARAIRCARSLRDRVRPLGLQVRIGLHTGECEAFGDRLGGIALSIGARVAASADPGEIRVSSTVKDLVAGSGLGFDDRGQQTLKGLHGDWRLFAVQ